MGRRGKVEEEIPVDSTAWILDNELASFFLMHTHEIKYMCMLGYTYMHGCKVFKALGKEAPFSYKFVNLIMACTGGGILVPILINAIPVPLSQDSYPIAILTSFLIHTYAPILREVLELSPIFKASVVFLYETLRAFVVTKFTLAAGATIPPSEFSFPIFGPIFCGTIAGCGGAFLPLNKGLDPIKAGMSGPMLSAFVAAVFLHLFVNVSEVAEAKKKGQVIVALWFVMFGLYSNGIFKSMMPAKNEKAAAPKLKKEK